MAWIMKLIQTLPLVLGSVFGIAQAIVKFAKEVITLIVNLFFAFTPDNGKFEQFVLKIRGWIDMIDGWLQKIKEFLITKAGITL